MGWGGGGGGTAPDHQRPLPPAYFGHPLSPSTPPQVFILEELLSPIVTPFLLIFPLRAKALEIIDFFRNFSVEVVGVGDICSFAQLDIRNHGNPQVREGKGAVLAAGGKGVGVFRGSSAPYILVSWRNRG